LALHRLGDRSRGPCVVRRRGRQIGHSPQPFRPMSALIFAIRGLADIAMAATAVPGTVVGVTLCHVCYPTSLRENFRSVAGLEIFKIGSRSLARPPDSQRHHGSPCHPRSWIAPIIGSCHPRSGFQLQPPGFPLFAIVVRRE
jgi:hypothetical protein